MLWCLRDLSDNKDNFELWHTFHSDDGTETHSGKIGGTSLIQITSEWEINETGHAMAHIYRQSIMSQVGSNSATLLFMEAMRRVL